MRNSSETPKPTFPVFRRKAEANCQRYERPHHTYADLQNYNRLNFRLGIAAMLLSLVSAVFAGIAVFDTKRALDQTDIALSESREQFKEESLARAWEILGRPTPGNSGKIAALETLYHGLELDEYGNVNLSGIDISCERMGGGWDEKIKTCARPTYLASLNLAVIRDPENPKKWTRRADLSDTNLSGANLSDASFTRADLSRTNFSSAILFRTDLSSAFLRNVDFSRATLLKTNFTDAVLLEVDFSGADISAANLTGLNLAGVNIAHANLNATNLSNVSFVATKNLTAEQIRKAFAFDDSWSHDNLPEYLKTGPASDWPHPVLCPAKLQANDGTYYAPFTSDYNTRDLPDGCSRSEHAQKMAE